MNLIMLLGAILFWIYEIEDIIKIYEKRKSRNESEKRDRSKVNKNDNKKNKEGFSTFM